MIQRGLDFTKDKHVGIEFYVSDTSLKAAANAVEVAGKTVGQALEAISAKLAASGDLTPQELETAKKVSKALDDGTLDLKQLTTCSGRQGFNLMDWIVGTAHASTGCALFDNAGKKVTDLTPQEREACRSEPADNQLKTDFNAFRNRRHLTPAQNAALSG